MEWGGILCCVHITPRANCAAITHAAPGYIIIAAVSRVTIAIVSRQRARASEPLCAPQSAYVLAHQPALRCPSSAAHAQVNLRLVSR